MHRTMTWVWLAAVLLLAVGLASSYGVQSLAQDAASPAAMQTQANQPVAIHQGTCQSPVSQPLHQLNNLIPYGQNDDGTFADVVGSVPQFPVLYQSANFDGSFDDFATQPAVVAVHQSPQNFGTIIACGDIGGSTKDGKMIVALRPISNSGFGGVAIIDSDEGGVLGIGEDQLNVTVYLVPQVTSAPAAIPAGQAPQVELTPTPTETP